MAKAPYVETPVGTQKADKTPGFGSEWFMQPEHSSAHSEKNSKDPNGIALDVVDRDRWRSQN